MNQSTYLQNNLWHQLNLYIVFQKGHSEENTNLSFQHRFISSESSGEKRREKWISFFLQTHWVSISLRHSALVKVPQHIRHWFNMNQQIRHDNDPPGLHKPDESKHVLVSREQNWLYSATTRGNVWFNACFSRVNDGALLFPSVFGIWRPTGSQHGQEKYRRNLPLPSSHQTHQ